MHPICVCYETHGVRTCGNNQFAQATIERSSVVDRT